MNPDAIADAACAKFAKAPHGKKREREAIAKKARLVALACNVRAHRMRITQELNAASPPAQGR